MISILIPTRKRAKKLKVMYESLHNTSSNINNIEVLLYIDKDDTQSIKFIENNSSRFTIPVKHIIGPRVSLGVACNELFKICTGELVMAGADDIVFKTKNWDEIIEKKFNTISDQICLFAVNDLYQNPSTLATHPIISKKALDIFGHFLPPEIDCNYGDEWLTYIFKGANRYYPMPDIIVEHMHWLVGKGDRDSTYAEGSANMKRHSYEAFTVNKDKRDRLIQKLQNHILGIVSTNR